ncbi:hypothetical protein H181DRAFT_03189 [Streptomyces sp. WMMB 714]|nr:hypothetical protein H181DRAFT_03189 [Streptomyces sp. WMMB 714]
MISVREDVTIKPQPQFWYELPYGYAQLDVYPSAQRMEDLARQILALPDDVRERADQVFRLYAMVMYEMQRHRVQGCALGMHPDERDGAATSVLTVSSVDSPGVNPKAVLATLLASGAGQTGESGIVPVELPCGPGFLTQTVQRPVPPSATPTQGGDDVDETPVWRGLLAIPDTRSSAIVALQVVTPSVHLADNYRGVLVGVGRTVTFTDPSPGHAEPEEGSVAHAVRSDFG